LIVSLTGEIDKDTGYVYDLGILRNLIKSEVEESFDHKNLNIEVPEFINLNPTAENISVVIYHKLRRCLPNNLDLKITLYETPRNFVSYSGE
jgi:6-pyruvoyltetrahydropterin/6-carboxytetrahydropterin synthase